jgi:DNA repair protein RadC
VIVTLSQAENRMTKAIIDIASFVHDCIIVRKNRHANVKELNLI